MCQLIYLFLTVLGLHCCVWTFFSCAEWGLCTTVFIVVHELLIAVASLVAECRFQGIWPSVVAAHRLQSTGSVVVVHRLSRFAACGIFLNQALNSCSVQCKADSQPLDHQGSPNAFYSSSFLSSDLSCFTFFYHSATYSLNSCIFYFGFFDFFLMLFDSSQCFSSAC